MLAKPFSADENMLWKFIWSWKGPQRIWNFLWIVDHVQVLTSSHRYNRYTSTLSLCERCSMGEETTLHVLQDHFHVKEIWVQHTCMMSSSHKQ